MRSMPLPRYTCQEKSAVERAHALENKTKQGAAYHPSMSKSQLPSLAAPGSQIVRSGSPAPVRRLSCSARPSSLERRNFVFLAGPSFALKL